jgi:putative component of toxin-antitoxin plasmid stabilization module
MAKMQAVYYRDAQGRQPVSDFIETLSPIAVQVAVDNQIDRLNMLTPADPPLPFPHSSQVEGELRELRCHYGRTLIRVLYRRSGNLFILLHARAASSGRTRRSMRLTMGSYQKWVHYEHECHQSHRTECCRSTQPTCTSEHRVQS